MCIATLRASSSSPPRTPTSTPIFFAGGWTYEATRPPFTASNRAVPATTTFSPSLPASSARSVSSSASAPGPPASTASSTLRAKARNSSLFETGSVSEPTATIVPLLPSAATRSITLPSVVARPARFAAVAMPCSRRSRLAASRSPFVSCSARLQSIIPAPVWSRSSLTSFAEISAIGALLCVCGSRLRSRLFGSGLLGGRLVRGRLVSGRLAGRLLARRDDLVVPFRHGLRLLRGGRLGAVAVRLGELPRRHLRLARGDPVGDRSDDQAARANRVVVAGNDVVGLVRIAVRVDERDDRQPEPARLTDRELLLAQVDDEDRVRLLAHVGDAAEVRIDLLELGEHRDP